MAFQITSHSLLHFYRKSYALDWITILILLLGSIFPFALHPFYRQFSLSDLRIAHPFAKVERVPVSSLIIYSVVCPVVVIVAGSLAFPSRRQDDPKHHKLHVSLLGLFTGGFLTTFLTDLIKNAVGRPRPDLLDRCQAVAGTPLDILVDVAVCTETNKHKLDEGFRSFPSGHSSMAFAGLGFLTFWIAGQLGSAKRGASLPNVVITAIPFIAALLIAISRTEDYRHDVYDVTVGSLIGITIAWWSYRRFFPSIKSPRSHEPYPPRHRESDEYDNDGKGRFEPLPLGGEGPSNRRDLEMGLER